MYKQHTHMVYSELHILPYPVLYQNANDNSYSTPLRHEVWNMDQKMIILGIDLCYNTFSRLGVQHQHYPEHDTVCLFILFPRIFFPWSTTPYLRFFYVRCCWNSLAKLTSSFWVLVWILICESNLFDPVIWTVEINRYM